MRREKKRRRSLRSLLKVRPTRVSSRPALEGDHGLGVSWPRVRALCGARREQSVQVDTLQLRITWLVRARVRARVAASPLGY